MSLKTNIRLWLTTLFAISAIGLQAQTTIKGTVKDQTGESVIGATVMDVANKKNATVSDFDGNFTLKVTGKEITVSFIGMKSKTINIAGKSVIDVVLEEDQENNMLNDVVVIGYTTVRKKDLTGAVSQVSGKQIEDIPVTNVTEALTGKMAGVNITTTEGSPDADIKIRVRGGGSLSQDNSPLYIVDGFEVSNINDIPSSEIETIDVLKDAASTAIYGARGANGVIIVTTKSGGNDNKKFKVTLNGSLGWRKMAKEVKVMSPYNFGIYQYELNSAGVYPPGTTAYGSWADLDLLNDMNATNYQKEVFGRTGSQHTWDLSVTGGDKDLNYLVSYAHNDQKAIMIGSKYRRDNLSGKMSAKLNKWLSADFKIAYSNEKVNGLSGGEDNNDASASNSLVAQTVRYMPIELVGDADDINEENSTSQRVNPLARINNTSKEKRTTNQTYNGGLTWRPFKGWRFSTKWQYQRKDIKLDQAWLSQASRNSKYGDSGKPQALKSRDVKKSITNTNTIQYDNKKLFGGRDKITAILGQEWKQTKEVYDEDVSTAYPETNDFDWIIDNMAAGHMKPHYSYTYPKDRMVSFFGQVLYTLDEKYLFNVTLRADGSSKFAKGNQWGWFPAAQFAWRMNEEKFLKNVDWLSNLKLRVSYGTAGNNRIPSNVTEIQYKMAQAGVKTVYFNETAASMYAKIPQLYNPELKWETTITRNIGIDYGFFRGRLNGSIDVYWNTTKDLLMKSRIQSSAGYLYQYQNFGQTSNKGIEFSANVVAVDKRNFTLNANFNIAYNYNKIDKLTIDDPWQSSSFAGSTFGEYNDYRVVEGGRLGEVWGYKLNGYYQVATFDAAGNFTGQAGDLRFNKGDGKWYPVDASGNMITDSSKYPDKSYNKTGGVLLPGGPRFADNNGDGVINESDKEKLGNTIPVVTGGFGIDGQVRFKFGTFDYGVFCNYSLGNKILNGTKAANAFNAGSAKGWNLVDDFDVENRFTWIDPATGVNIGRPHSVNTFGTTAYPDEYALMNRLATINNGRTMYNPAAATTMPITDYALEDASFLRLQSITIGYSLPRLLVMKYHVQSARIYFTAYNLACWTKYSGYDPEVDVSSNPMTPGIDYAAYPKSRSYTVGINVTF